MEAYQERVIEEKKELDERIDKMERFMLSDAFAELDPGERKRMDRQLGVMEDYSWILGERIENFAPARQKEEE